MTKLDSSGSTVVYSTFVGGSAFDSGNGIAVDKTGAAYVAGFTGSLNYPTTPGSFDPSQNGGSDAFVTKLDSTGSRLEYSTYLGGAGFSFEGANGVAVDREGSAYVTGFTGSGAFPATPGAFDTTKNGTGNDVYVTKLNPAGAALAYSTFLGGTTSDTGNGVAVDGVGRAYVTGFTASADFPATPNGPDSSHNGGNDAFVATLDSIGSALAYSTFLGGAGSDSGQGIAADESGRVTSVTGSTASSDYPTTWGAHDRTYNGNGDAFVATFDRSSTLAYSTFLGGAGSEVGIAVAVGADRKRAFVTGSTSSTDFPSSPGALDGSYNGAGDVFVASAGIPQGGE